MTQPDKRPVARPIGKAELEQRTPESGGPATISAADIADSQSSLSTSSSSPRIGHVQLANISLELTQQDHQLIEFMEKFRLARGKQLQRIFHGESLAQGRAARRQLLRLSKIDVLQRLDRRIGGVNSGSNGYVYALGLVGQRLGKTGKRARRHSESSWVFQAHTLAITESYVQLSQRKDNFSLVRFDPEPHAWRQQSSAFGESQHLRPDAFAVLDDSKAGKRQYWFIEVDLDTESSTVIAKKMRRYSEW